MKLLERSEWLLAGFIVLSLSELPVAAGALIGDLSGNREFFIPAWIALPFILLATGFLFFGGKRLIRRDAPALAIMVAAATIHTLFLFLSVTRIRRISDLLYSSSGSSPNLLVLALLFFAAVATASWAGVYMMRKKADRDREPHR